MGPIKRLPEAVRNTVRSGVVLFDLTRVIEELVFNSLDAGATKVSVYVGVGTCYVKVVDDGSGISREGLVLVGERYVTTKLQELADMDAASATFGFRGEALASISDVSLLEVITKAYGRPNGYRKVMKGSKCLFLGIDDDRKDVVESSNKRMAWLLSVVARDLFYNQPVRRKYMQSSPKKVLQSVKKCIFRIALVHSNVSFKVFDMEREDELLSTCSSSSPLSLLMSSFGIENSGFLHEVNANDGLLKMSGYMSSPSDSISIKAFQYVYINSRFVCKGPIHKLLNQLAASFDCLGSWKVNNGSLKGKRCRSETCPAYILNLCCPRSFYDLNFEPLKTFVVFKDWELILTFIEKTICTVWMKSTSYGESLNSIVDKLGKDEMWKKHDNKIISAGEDAEWVLRSSRFRNHRASLHLSSSPFKNLTKEGNLLFNGERQRITTREFHLDPKELEEEDTEMEFLCQPEYSLSSLDDSFAEYLPILPCKNDHYPQACHKNVSSKDNYFLENSFSADERRSIHVEGDILSSKLGKEYVKANLGVSHEPLGTAVSFDGDDIINEFVVNEDIKKPFLQSCSSEGYLPIGGASFPGEEGFESSIDHFRNKRKRICHDERIDILEAGTSNQNLWQGEASCYQHPSGIMRKRSILIGFDVLSRACPNLFSAYADPFTEEAYFLSESLEAEGKSGSNHQSLNFEWCSEVSDPFHLGASGDDGHFTNKNALQGNFKFGKGTNYRQLGGAEEICKFSYGVTLKRPNQGKSTSASTGSDFEDYDHSNEGLYKFFKKRNLSDKCTLEHSDMLIDDEGSLALCSKDFGEYGRLRDQYRYQDCEPDALPKERSGRSHSAPPFHRHMRQFISSTLCSTVQTEKQNTFNCEEMFPETGTLKNLQKSPDTCPMDTEPSSVEDLVFSPRLDMKKSNTILVVEKTQKDEKLNQSICPQAQREARNEDFISKEIQNAVDSGTKWKISYLQTMVEYWESLLWNNNTSCDIHNEDTILNISLGLLHLAGNSLIPESINKSCLENAKVLHQVDKKFIPVVAAGTLAVIDQHAADERIRLEELRQKVLSGEGNSVTYLDAEQELVLPEIGHQLLQTYAEQIKDWGWICNIHSQNSRNLSILHRQPTVLTLLAVPCILGVNLSDVDLLEFLQQLSDTDGSSTIPPSVLRVLNSKACRGAIMFGDSLLPSECSLLVEELKKTSLCFQCAHGRPTTVPIVNLEELHKQIAQLGALSDNSSELWHGLRRHEVSLERTSQRLSASRG